MRRREWLVAATLSVATGLGTLAAAPAAAQDQDLDELRDLVPPAFPGESDIDEADVLFQALAAAYVRNPMVDDVGGSSRLTGPCGGWAFSYDEDGALIDAAFDAGDDGPPVDIFDGGQAFTSGNPFDVDTSGIVAYYGFAPRTGDGPREHRWEIVTSGISVDQGGDPNSNAENRNSGLVDLGEDLPIEFTAKVRIEGTMTSDNLAPCTGHGHVRFRGNGLTDPVGLGALALLGGGLLGLLFNARPARTWKE